MRPNNVKDSQDGVPDTLAPSFLESVRTIFAGFQVPACFDPIFRRLKRMKINFAIEVSGERDEVFPWINDNQKKQCFGKKASKEKISYKKHMDNSFFAFVEETKDSEKSLVMPGIITRYIKVLLAKAQMA